MKRWLILVILLFIFAINVKASTLPSEYSSLNYSYVPSVKNQYMGSNCWSFTANACVEISAKKEGIGNFNLSEKHMEYSLVRYPFIDNNLYNPIGLNRELNSGGNVIYAAFYYFRFNGPILYSKMPNTYNNNKLASYYELVTEKPLLLVGDFSIDTYSSCTEDAIAKIKRDVIEYGSVTATIRWDLNYNNNQMYYYYDGKEKTNHAVNIIGWNDDISSSSFSRTASNNGAFLVRNSWGDKSGLDGYYYVSYDDVNICKSIGSFSEISINDYDYGYQSTNGIYNMSVSSSKKMYIASKFVKKDSQDEYLDRISFYSEKNSAYNIYIVLNGTIDNKDNWQLLKTTDILSEGMKTIKFKKIRITDNFSIIIENINQKTFKVSCNTHAENNINYYIDYQKEANYYSTDGNNWKDLYYLNTNGNSSSNCASIIYAYTKLSRGEVDFSIKSITSSSEYVKVKSTDFYTIDFTFEEEVDDSLFSHKILDEFENDVTDLFLLTNDFASLQVKINVTSHTVSGNYKYVLEYKNRSNSINFTVYPLVTSSVYEIKNNKIKVTLGSAKEIVREDFISNLNINNSYKITDKNNQEILDNYNIGTNYNLIIDDEVYKIIILGDINGDGKIKSNDSLLINKYLVGLTNLDENEIIASDVNKDGIIKSNDSLFILRFLVGLRTEL